MNTTANLYPHPHLHAHSHPTHTPSPLLLGICVNTTANLDENGDVLGNKTEGALLLMVDSPNTVPSIDYYATRKELKDDTYDRYAQGRGIGEGEGGYRV